MQKYMFLAASWDRWMESLQPVFSDYVVFCGDQVLHNDKDHQIIIVGGPSWVQQIQDRDCHHLKQVSKAIW